MSANTLFILLISILIFNYVLDTVLDYLNERAAEKPIPKVLSDVYAGEEYKKSRAYQIMNYKMGLFSSTIGFVFTLLFFVLKGPAWLDRLVRTWTGNEVWVSILYLGILGLASGIISFPFSVYKTFVIEQKFGFNKTTLKTFLSDTIKNILLSGLIGGFILFIIITLYKELGNNFWWMAWLVVTLISICMVMFYSQLLVPLFNKQTPLAEGSLKDKIEKLAHKLDFELQNIYVIDGSKRSSKANAYFSGLGKRKRIVLFDTLIEQLTEDQVVAVLAHEIGHYKKNHILWTVVLSTLQMGILFYVFSLFISNPLFANALGISTPSFHVGLIVFSFLLSPLTTFISLITNLVSRKFEYQADAFAKEQVAAENLIASLKKLSSHTLGNLNPHPWYEFVHYSHPTLAKRINKLQA